MTQGIAKPLVVVLGASGLLGTAVTRQLADRPVRLRAVGRRRTAVPPGCRAEVEVVRSDLTEPGALAAAVADADVVIHLVAHIAGPATWRVSAGDRLAERVNLGLVRDLVDACRARPRDRPPVVVFAGSMSQVGRPRSARIDETHPDEPLTVYDRQKLAAEQALKAADADGVLRAITLRLATLFTRGTDGTALDRGVVAAMIRRALAGQPLTMWHDGTVKRDLLCVDDAARAFTAAVDHADALAGGHWLVGTGVATAVGDLFRALIGKVSAHTGQAPVPLLRVEPADHSSPTDLIDFVLDPAAFRRATGWVPTVALDEALDRAVAAVAAEAGAPAASSR
ncbi:NAD-dependent epimerase/dehydratase [Saccharothrix australiensis]|uniref:dTDP-4-keto-6-deoxyhexose 4-ketoreductase n=1 Tax=Saccharothrix australiensis TaxID=2072 RepID=A0A495W0R0_9PSEU|nr:NAD-dependent epimerase/dehydratase [Saccharothrix australiensis]RKT54700.1 dTDP-4-keto-6-deoxyhexose 4-ketoreductase [Saccharothrix australiensis]